MFVGKTQDPIKHAITRLSSLLPRCILSCLSSPTPRYPGISFLTISASMVSCAAAASNFTPNARKKRQAASSPRFCRLGSMPLVLLRKASKTSIPCKRATLQPSDEEPGDNLNVRDTQRRQQERTLTQQLYNNRLEQRCSPCSRIHVQVADVTYN